MARLFINRALLAGAALIAAPAMAQTATSIVPDAAGSALSTATTAARTGRVTVIDGGTLAGTNLFHSFTTFNLATGDTARWTTTLTDPARVTNVINRVTGGAISEIDGRIDTAALPKAAFFFINPAGIVLGQGARVDVPGAAHFSTAETLRFADGGTFSVRTPGGSVFSMAAPAQFGFLGAQGTIALKTQTKTLGTGGLDLSASDITLTDARFATPWLRATAVGSGTHTASLAGGPIDSPDGRFVARDSRISVGSGGVQLVGGGVRLASTTLTMRTADEVPLGDIALLGDRVFLTGSTLTAMTSGTAPSGSIRIDAVVLVADDTVLEAHSARGATGDVGSILATAGRIRVTGNSLLSASTDGASKAGNVTLDARQILIDASAVRTSSDCLAAACTHLGQGGTITLHAPSLVIDDNALLSASAFGDGDAGGVDLSGSRVIIANGSVVRSNTARSGKAGLIGIDAATLTLDGATIVSETGGTGRAGPISVTASGTADLRNTIVSSTGLARSLGDAGSVTFNTGTMALYESTISSDVLKGARGDAAPVVINAAALRLDRGSLIGSTTLGGGAGGQTSVNVTGALELYTESAISADTRAGGAGGDVQIGARTIVVDNALITADSFSGGNAGAVSVNAAQLLIANAGNVSSDARGAGKGGAVNVTAGRMTVDEAFVSADSYGLGGGGLITVTATDLVLVNEGKIRSASYGAGAAGSIIVGARHLALDGNSSINSDSLDQGASGFVRVDAERLTVANNSYVTSDGVSEGGGGAVAVKAGRLSLISGGFIAAETYQDGISGEVDVEATTLLLDNGHIGTQARPGSSGNAGTIRVKADTITARDGSFIASGTFGPGTAGDLEIGAKRITILDTSFFGTDSNGSGKAGTVNVTAGRIALTGGGAITSNAFEQGAGGDINVTADTLILTDGVIATSADPAASGDAGDIAIGATRLALARGVISSDSLGSGSAGTIGIDAGSLTMDGGAVSGFAAATAQAAGAITLQVKEELSLTNGAAITASSANAQTSGTITITASSVRAQGGDTAITTSNSYDGKPGADGAAGMITLAAARVAFSDGATLASNALAGPAGDITVTMPSTGIFTLVGAHASGVVTTSSGPGTGGRITINSPLALVSNGGSILAQGQLGGALLELGSRYFIQSADRTNRIAVDGAIRIESNLYDVSAGTSLPMVDFLDASKVLLGQCASARATGVTSQIGWRNTGPYAARTRSDPQASGLELSAQSGRISRSKYRRSDSTSIRADVYEIGRCSPS